MKNAYPMKFTKQTFKIGDQVTIWWIPARTQEKFISRCRGSYEIVAILKNGIYKLADEYEILNVPINEDLLRLYKNYDFMKSIIVND